MIRFIVRCRRAAMRKLIWFVCRLLPIDNKKIAVSSYSGRGYGDNPKYIVEKLLESGVDLRIIWFVKNDHEKSTLPCGVEACKTGTVRSVYHLLTAKVWIDNARKPSILLKRKKQFYMQTWHGFALKRIEKDAADKLSHTYVKYAKRDSKNINCIISCSRFMTEIYRNSFWYDGEIIEIGAPRNDIILKNNPDIREKICKYFNLQSNKKMILYAPTFRADKNMEVYDVDYMRLKNACEKRFGGEFVIITRLHPNIAAQSDNIAFDDVNLINGTFYPDMQELMLACDIIITDYSSVMFDFALTFKPCFQFAVDIEEYKNDRNFYFEIDKLPFPLATNNDELENNVINFSDDVYREELEKFYDEVGMCLDGDASQKCAEIIIKNAIKRSV